MRATRYFAAVDSHTEGMPTRVVTGGLGPIPGDSMPERRLYFEQHLDELRLLLMREPRGHSSMSGAFLQPATRADADWGVLFVEVSGCLPMCGHGAIGVATVLVECGMVAVSEPETVIRLDTPAGLVEATVAVSGGHAERVRLRIARGALLAAVDAAGKPRGELRFTPPQSSAGHRPSARRSSRDLVFARVDLSALVHWRLGSERVVMSV